MTLFQKILDYRANFVKAFTGFSLLCGTFLLISTSAFGKHIPRTILVLYSKKLDERILWTPAHSKAEMPLNHLGLTVKYHSVDDGLPSDKMMSDPDIRGILTWNVSGSFYPDVRSLLKWATKQVKDGKKFVIMGDPGFYTEENKRDTKIEDEIPLPLINKFLATLGIADRDWHVSQTFNTTLVKKDRKVVEFERKYTGTLPQYRIIVPISDKVKSHLVARKGGDKSSESHLVVTSPNGGYVSRGYEMFEISASEEVGSTSFRKWYINPFEFFRLAFQTDDIPKADTSILAGMRIYYSHIDGDGWVNVTHLEQYRGKDILSSQVILDHVITPYWDLPVTVAPIVAELHPGWTGSQESIQIAKALFRLPQVEMGSHTYSHPYWWEFFNVSNEKAAEKEEPVLPLYKTKTWKSEKEQGTLEWINYQVFGKGNKKKHKKIHKNYTTPRGFAAEKYDTQKEIRGSIDYINQLSPGKKKVEVLQWSGDTAPYEEAIAESRKANVYNLNGGDSRFDKEYMSYAWVSPVGRQVGNEIQIYASNSNENTYTELWTGRFHGFRYLVKTVKNTGTPIMIKPMNVYYHMYSGERLASLKALLDNLDYARSIEINPIETSRFAGIGLGFFKADFQSRGPNQWSVKNHGALQTIRFDHACMKTVDYSRSKGVIGHSYLQGSLYIHLDESVKEPLFALKDHSEFDRNALEPRPYLVKSRWRIWDLKTTADGFSFQTHGYGHGDMRWMLPKKTALNIRLEANGQVYEKRCDPSDSNLAVLKLDPKAINGARVKVTYLS